MTLYLMAYIAAYVTIVASFAVVFYFVEMLYVGRWRWCRQDITYGEIASNIFWMSIWPLILAFAILCIPFVFVVVLVDSICDFCSMKFWKTAAIRRKNKDFNAG